MATKTFRYEGASLRLVEMEQGLVALSNLWSKTRGQGHVRALLQEAVDYADENNLKVVLVAQQYGKPSVKTLSNQQLQSLYEKFGFVVEGKAKAPVFMIRQPRK